MRAPAGRAGMRWAWAAVPVGAVAAAQMVPSVVSLGQWLPVRALPGGWCRWRGPEVPAVALTFDDGPDPLTTPSMLDRLDELGLPATFFCLGEHAAAHPDLVAEALRRGHQVETHGYAHAHHFARPPWWVRGDLERALGAMALAGVRPRWFRPPYGQATGPTLLEARRHGLAPVLWSAWGREWDEPDAGAVARRVTSGLHPGAIVLLHDADVDSPPGSCRRTHDALGAIAEGIAARGLRAVTLDRLVDAA
ncbi:MAG TPA: polysaccharide deacetylase family protein [Acidimicrobiales bacterium]|nr:polysaccharide deacetylase family protein [Acidimicrobiales bacterium]